MNPGTSPELGESWWKSNGSWRSLSPHSISTHGVKDEQAVRHYMKSPNSHYSGGGRTPVCVVRGVSGGLWAREGAHRIEAARRSGRSVRAYVVDYGKERGQERKGRGAER